MNYTDLDESHKRELLVNFRAALLAMSMLSSLSEKKIEFWTKEFFLSAYLEVSDLSPEQVDSAIANIESERSVRVKPNDNSFYAITNIEVEKHES